MDIPAYLSEHRETLSGLAARMGLHKGHLHKIATGERGWNSDTVLAIEDATNGLVTANDLSRTRRLYLRREARAARARAR